MYGRPLRGYGGTTTCRGEIPLSSLAETWRCSRRHQVAKSKVRIQSPSSWRRVWKVNSQGKGDPRLYDNRALGGFQGALRHRKSVRALVTRTTLSSLENILLKCSGYVSLCIVNPFITQVCKVCCMAPGDWCFLPSVSTQITLTCKCVSQTVSSSRGTAIPGGAFYSHRA